MVETKAIYAALSKVQAGLANVPKNGEMKFGATSYKYLKADDVQEAINPLLNDNGVIVRPEYTVETLTRGRGEGSPYVYVHLSLTYVAVADGSEFTIRAVGESAATDDKSINKALTQAIKNALPKSKKNPNGTGVIRGEVKDHISFAERDKFDISKYKGGANVFHYNDDGSIDVLQIQEPKILNAVRYSFKHVAHERVFLFAVAHQLLALLVTLLTQDSNFPRFA